MTKSSDGIPEHVRIVHFPIVAKMVNDYRLGEKVITYITAKYYPGRV